MVDDRVRRRLVVSGVVQGVGFRPFVYALASKFGLSGSVGNDSSGVTIEIEGSAAAVAEFRHRLPIDAPPLARIDAITVEVIATQGGTGFSIAQSRAGSGRTLVSPDIATCDDCLAELADPADRRYRHPFITCTNCGPRFTIITGLPYDRPATTMAGFPLCAACAAEYADPADRRFHAQTDRLPRLRPDAATASAGSAGRHRIGTRSVRPGALLAGGAIVAVKGLGGYHLACDAADTTAVSALRKRKDRGRQAVRGDGRRPGRRRRARAAQRRRAAPARPIRGGPSCCCRGAPTRTGRWLPTSRPDSPDLGVMLPYTPVHQLLLGLPGDPPGPQVLVMTSGNLAGEPIVTDDDEALSRLAPLADAWLSHDRPIHVPCDDSVLSASSTAIELPVRRSRGYAPLPLALPFAGPAGAGRRRRPEEHLLRRRRAATPGCSAHVGDMDDLATLQAFDAAEEHLRALTGVRPGAARRRPAPGLPLHRPGPRRTPADRPVDHGAAPPRPRRLGDGRARPRRRRAGDRGRLRRHRLRRRRRGLGRRGPGRRLRRLPAGRPPRYVPLPGGDAGVRNPYRMALSHLRAAGLAWDRRPAQRAPPARDPERHVLARQLETGLNCVPTSSMGRLFDAVSSLAGVCHRSAYEAQAAIELEGLARPAIERRRPRRTASTRRDDGGD